MPAPTIELAGLGKTFNTRGPDGRGRLICALQEVTCAFHESELCLLVGPNGSGKTTLLRLMAGSLLPSTGRLRMMGQDCCPEHWPEALIAWIGAEGRGFYGPLNAFENLDFFGQLYGIADTVRRPRIEELLNLFGLIDKAHASFQTYSHGQRTRLALVRAFLIDAPILLLDEPTEGLDPETREFLWTILRRDMAEKWKKTIVVATHDVEQARPYAHRLLTLQQGRLSGDIA